MTGPYMLVVAAGGAVGAPVRYLVDRWVQDGRRGVFPWGTFVINATGAFLSGLIIGLAVHHGLPKVLQLATGTGVCGAYTTFSTFSYETVQLVEDGSLAEAVLNVAVSLVVGLVAAAAGLGLAMVM